MSSRKLLLTAGILLALNPLLYYIGFGNEGVLWIDDNQGGYSFQYAATRIWAHWLTLLALMLTATVLVRQTKVEREKR